MKILNDEELRNYFLEQLQEKCSPIHGEIRVSDLVYCLRKPYWRKLKSRKLSEKQLQFFLDGHQRHSGLQGLVQNLEHELEVRNYGIVGHLDLMDKHPIEIKTTRARCNGQKPSHYLRQCAHYCLLTKTEVCSLITQYIVDGVFTFEKIEFSPRDLNVYLNEMLQDRDRLLDAFERVSPELLPYPEEWQCRFCEFKEDCNR